MIHHFPDNFIFEEPHEFTDPFRYVPHPAVKAAAAHIMERISSDPKLSCWFSEGKMLGVLVCRHPENSKRVCYISAFSGSVGGRSMIEGFVPPIYDLMALSGNFKRREAEISDINRHIRNIEESESFCSVFKELKETEQERDYSIEQMRTAMSISKKRRDSLRSGCSESVAAELIRESQHEKAEFRRLKSSWEEKIADIRSRLDFFADEIESLKQQRATMSENLQNWIFQQYIVHNASGESSSIADIFASSGLIPPGGTGECAAPKLLEYAYLHGLKPLAMGEFWYGKDSETAVRSHGRFYPSCTSKCGPLLKYMLHGLSSPSSVHPATISDEQPVMIPDPVIVYEDESVLVVEKPSGMPSVPGLDGRTSLQEWLGEGIHQVHRLDMDTSGVMVFAKTHQAAVNLRIQFEEHSVRKIYMARISAADKPPQCCGAGRISLPLCADYDERPRQKVDFRQGKPAYTEYETVKMHSDGTADILLYPHTGRTHQLRVHCAHAQGLNRPILGDLLYGAHKASEHSSSGTSKEYPVPERLCLHSWSITFRHPATDKPLTFTSSQLCYR